MGGRTRLAGGRIRAGVWEGVVAADAPPALEVVHQEAVLPGLTVAPMPDRPGEWALRLPVPVALLADGVQTFVLRETGGGGTLGHFTIIAGMAMEDDIRAEIDLLRAELDLLKRAFRRHCVETAV